MMTTLDILQMLTDRAIDGDDNAAATLRLIGECVDMTASKEGLCELQGLLHDAAVDKWQRGSRGDAIGNFWEHIPSWSAL